MSTELARPGVEVIQEFRTTSPTIVTPTLVPCIVGPAFEVIDITESDGTINEDAADGTYDQFPQTVAQTDFPSPRGNIDEVNVLEDEIEVYFVQSGSLYELANGTDPVNPGGSSSQFGDAFLVSHNYATSPAVRSQGEAGVGAGFDMDGKVFQFAVDVAAEGDTSSDVSITFTTTGANWAVADIAETINDAAGDDIAEAIEYDPSGSPGEYCLQIRSLNYGAGASVTVRPSDGAAELFSAAFGALVYDGLNDSFRVEGSGFRGQDDGDGDLETPWIEFSIGTFRFLDADGSGEWGDESFPGAGDDDAPGLVDDDDEFNAAAEAALTFAGAAPDIPLQASDSETPGDYFYGDGTRIESAEVIEAQVSRFRLGTLDTVNSVFDDAGNPTSRVYTPVEVDTLFSADPLAPRYAWFQARGLQKNNIDPAGEVASLEGSVDGLPATPGEVEGEVTDYALAGRTLILTPTVDGVQGEEYTYTFTASPANIAALVALLQADATMALYYGFEGNSVGGSDYLRIYTLETGADQKVTVSLAGTANVALGFSDSQATVGTGKDVEFAQQASITGSYIDCGNFAGAEVLEITVTDSFGTDTFNLVRGAGSPADFDALIAELEAAMPTLIERVTFEAAGAGANVIDQLVITTREGGTGVSVVTNTNPGTTDPLFGFDDTGPESAAVGIVDVTGLGGGLAAETITFDVDALVDPDVGPIVLTEGVDWGDAGPGPGEQTTSDSIVLAINTHPTLSAVMLADNLGGTVVPVTCTILPGGTLGNLATIVAGGPLIPGITTFAGGEDIIGDSDDATQQAADDLIAGETFVFSLDEGCEFELIFATNSLMDAIDAINEEVGGYDVASVGDVSSQALMLSSLLVGLASQVKVEDGQAATNMGMSTTAVQGTGRPDPDFWLDISGNVNIGGQIFRNSITGTPDCPISSTIYIPYRGLRLDVTPSAEEPGLLTIEDTTQLDAIMDPISERNPLALGVYFALLNAPGITVAAIGVDEVSGTEENGTPTAYTTAAEFLEAHEVYAIAPLTHSSTVHQLFKTHVDFMSEPEQKGERILFFNPEVPTEENPTAVASGTGEVSASDNTFLLDENPSAALTAQGINPANPIDYDEGLYLEVELNSVNYKYSVSAVSGVAIVVRDADDFAADENTDGFYATTTMVGPVPNVDYSLKIRGSELVIAGSTLPDLGGIADTVAEVATAYQDRRLFYVFPDSCLAELGGPTLELPGFYMGCAVAGMVGQLPPQQPFTNYPITGFSGVQGSNDTFRESHMNVMAAGGVYTIIQEADGAPLQCRHQLSTDTTSIEKRELSITKAVDYVAKFMRGGLRAFIGRYNITPAFIDTLSSVVQGQLNFLTESGVILGGALNNIVQDEDAPDTVLIDVTLDIQYPCNYIRLTLII